MFGLGLWDSWNRNPWIGKARGPPVSGSSGIRFCYVTRGNRAGESRISVNLSGTRARDVSWQSRMVRAVAHWNFDAN
jgi:hypothetical protein